MDIGSLQRKLVQLKRYPHSIRTVPSDFYDPEDLAAFLCQISESGDDNKQCCSSTKGEPELPEEISQNGHSLYILCGLLYNIGELGTPLWHPDERPKKFRHTHAWGTNRHIDFYNPGLELFKWQSIHTFSLDSE